MSQSLLRAQLLIEQRRWDLAEREIHLALADDSQNAEAHRLLAMCLLNKDQLDQATAEAQQAIHLAPDEPRGHLVLGWIMAGRNRYAEAIASAEEAIRLDPYQPRAFELLGNMEYRQRRWPEALAAVEQALRMDPEDTDCNNLRAQILIKLGRKGEAGLTIQAALHRHPDDSLTHANQGWTLLHAGDHRQAMVHFRESLRLDPTQEWARAGIIESMKARNIVYRLLLQYFFWMSRWSTRAQFGIVLGMFLLQRVVATVSKSNPELAPFLTPVLIAYFIFALLTWLGSPLCDLLLFSDKFGRLILSSEQKTRALLVGGILASAALTFAASLWLGDNLLPIAAICLALLAIPSSVIGVCPEGWPRRTMLAATLALAALGIIPLVVDVLLRCKLLDNATAPFAGAALKLNSDYFFWGILGAQFLANSLVNVTVRR